MGGLGGGLGGGDDQYGAVELDLTKVVATKLPSKPFEKKTEEEKVEDKAKLTSKSSLKTTKSDFDNKEKKEVRYGKAITYQVDGDSEPSVLLAENDKKIIGEKDLSEGREAKEAAKKALEDEAERIKEEQRLMQAWKEKQAAKAKEEEQK